MIMDESEMLCSDQFMHDTEPEIKNNLIKGGSGNNELKMKIQQSEKAKMESYQKNKKKDMKIREKLINKKKTQKEIDDINKKLIKDLNDRKNKI